MTPERESEGWQLAVDRGRALEAAEVQRDELVEALERVTRLGMGGREADEYLVGDMTRIARAALAKVRGEADTAAGNQGVGGFPGHTAVRGEAGA